MIIIILFLLLIAIICTIAYFAGNSVMKTNQKISDELHDIKLEIIKAIDDSTIVEITDKLDVLIIKHQGNFNHLNTITVSHLRGMLEGKRQLLIYQFSK